MTIYLQVLNNVVIQVFIADSPDNLITGPGITVVSTTDNNVGIGWVYDGTQFTAPPQDYNNMWLLIQGERDRRTSTGGYKVGDYWFHSDDISRIQQLALTMMGANMPSGVMWKTMSGAFVPMTPTLAGQIFQAAAASDISIFSVAEAKKAEMLATSTPATYDYLSGWPLMYGE